MREEVRDRGRLEHMLTAIGNVEEFTKDVSKESFVNSQAIVLRRSQEYRNCR